MEMEEIEKQPGERRKGMYLYVVHDKVTGESFPIFEQKNDMAASRAFFNGLKENPYADDLVLLCVGEIDHETNEIKAISPYEVEILVTPEESE